MITLFEVMKITTEPSKGGCVVSTHEFVMGYTPLQRTRKGNKIGSSRGTALHSAGPLGKGQMRHGVVTTTPRTRRGAGKRILLGRGQFLRIVFSKFALNSNDTAVYRNTSVDKAGRAHNQTAACRRNLQYRASAPLETLQVSWICAL